MVALNCGQRNRLRSETKHAFPCPLPPPSTVIILHVILISLIFLIILCSNLLFYSTISALFFQLCSNTGRSGDSSAQSQRAHDAPELCLDQVCAASSSQHCRESLSSCHPTLPVLHFHPKWLPFLPRNAQNLPTPPGSRWFLQSSGYQAMMGTPCPFCHKHHQPTCFSCSSRTLCTHMRFCGKLSSQKLLVLTQSSSDRLQREPLTQKTKAKVFNLRLGLKTDWLTHLKFLRINFSHMGILTSPKVISYSLRKLTPK